MRPKMLPIVAAGLLLGVSSAALAQSATQEQAPGQKMQGKGSVPDTSGASGYAPGQQMQNEGALPDKPGASGYAPGRSETTGSGAAEREGGGMRGGTEDKAGDKER